MANPVFTTHYSEITDTTFVESSNTGEVTSTETVLVSPPGGSERKSIRNVTVYNPDASAQTVSILLRQGSNYSTICKMSLDQNDTLIIDQVIILNSISETLTAGVGSFTPFVFNSYLAGGSTGNFVVTAYKLVYATDTTTAQSSANLSEARASMAAATDTELTSGYFAGGISSSRVATTDKLNYITDITAVQSSANLSQAKALPAGVSDLTIAGYFAGGSTGIAGTEVATADKLVYATDTTAAQSSANLSQARASLAGVSDLNTAGYFAGGISGASTRVTTADKLIYATDTTAAQGSANLSQARSNLAGVNSETDGYFVGGNTGANVVTADKLVYATDTTAAQGSADLSQATGGLAGVSG